MNLNDKQNNKNIIIFQRKIIFLVETNNSNQSFQNKSETRNYGFVFVVWSPNVKAIRQYFRLENKENMNIK
jgi:hypothetical protein